MRTSQRGLKALAVSEGIVDTAYLDNATPPVWTIGIGHTTGAGAPNPKDWIGRKMTIKQVFEMFDRDIVKYEAIIDRNVKVPLKQHEYDALVHFVYNIGEPNFKKSKLLTNLNAGNKTEAWKSGFHGWLKPASLRGRRDRERAIAQAADYGPAIAPLYTADVKGKTKRNGSIDLSKIKFGAAALPESPVDSSASFWVTLLQAIASWFRK